ncbi:transposase [Shewanella psychropiezotolerans]|uniref:Transposase n=1 Tax=Shewanella psychropiezotolerans TaxID=2593655 RepID=A0ABX5X2B5_9GAMM|nr:transposase [Shewanella sp. YLB-07]QDO84088.1 transposase [Shewanella psychropiezotolerans]
MALIGWDYVGRVRNRTHCKKVAESEWAPIKKLYGLASSRAKTLGTFHMGDGARKSKSSRASAEREKEPWLLATSLCESTDTAKRAIKIYATRIQIEESFRDVKTGLKMNDSGTRIAMLKSHWRAAISSLLDLVRDPQACY